METMDYLTLDAERQDLEDRIQKAQWMQEHAVTENEKKTWTKIEECLLEDYGLVTYQLSFN